MDREQQADCLFPPDHFRHDLCCASNPCILEFYRPCEAEGGCWDRSTCNGAYGCEELRTKEN